MAISLRATSTVVTATGSPATVTLNLPAGSVATDILIASFSFLGGTGATITPPTGWTLVPGSRTNSTTVVGGAMYWALGNVASLAFGFSGATKVVGACTGYVGVDNTTPIDVNASGQANAANTLITAPSVTTVTLNAWAVCLFGTASASTFTIGAGLTDRGSGATGASGTKNALDTGDSNAGLAIGATGTFTSTASLSAVNVGVTTALRPAASGTAFTDSPSTFFLVIPQTANLLVASEVPNSSAIVKASTVSLATYLSQPSAFVIVQASPSSLAALLDTPGAFVIIQASSASLAALLGTPGASVIFAVTETDTLFHPGGGTAFTASPATSFIVVAASASLLAALGTPSAFSILQASVQAAGALLSSPGASAIIQASASSLGSLLGSPGTSVIIQASAASLESFLAQPGASAIIQAATATVGAFASTPGAFALFIVTETDVFVHSGGTPFTAAPSASFIVMGTSQSMAVMGAVPALSEIWTPSASSALGMSALPTASAIFTPATTALYGMLAGPIISVILSPSAAGLLSGQSPAAAFAILSAIAQSVETATENPATFALFIPSSVSAKASPPLPPPTVLPGGGQIVQVSARTFTLPRTGTQVIVVSKVT